jgi:hypothetical protein
MLCNSYIIISIIQIIVSTVLLILMSIQFNIYEMASISENCDNNFSMALYTLPSIILAVIFIFMTAYGLCSNIYTSSHLIYFKWYLWTQTLCRFILIIIGGIFLVSGHRKCNIISSDKITIFLYDFFNQWMVVLFLSYATDRYFKIHSELNNNIYVKYCCC